MTVPRVPWHSLYIAALTDAGDDPNSAIQYAVLDSTGERHTYGDQQWVADGRAVIDAHLGGRIQRRRVTVTYGTWVDANDPDPVTVPDSDALLDLRDKARAWRRTLEGRVVLTYGATTAALIAAVDALEEDRRG